MDEEPQVDTLDGPQISTGIQSKISTGVLQMNFMKRTYNQVQKQNKRNERKKRCCVRVFPTLLRFDDDPMEGLDGIVREDRFTRLEDLRFGRFSFGGKNPETEKLMEYHDKNRKKQLKEEGECSDEEISAQEMANTFSSYRQPAKRPLEEVKREAAEQEDIIVESTRAPKRRKSKVKVQGEKMF